MQLPSCAKQADCVLETRDIRQWGEAPRHPSIVRGNITSGQGRALLLRRDHKPAAPVDQKCWCAVGHGQVVMRPFAVFAIPISLATNGLGTGQELAREECFFARPTKRPAH